jgi:hypothetical protein
MQIIGFENEFIGYLPLEKDLFPRDFNRIISPGCISRPFDL